MPFFNPFLLNCSLRPTPAFFCAFQTSLRIVSCGGSPLPDAVALRAVALFGCEFFGALGSQSSIFQMSFPGCHDRGVWPYLRMHMHI